MTPTRLVQMLREHVAELREFDASSYPGPEPGKLWSLSGGNPGAVATAAFQDLISARKAEHDKRRKEKKKADIRPHLRKLALWLQKRAP